MKYVLCPLLNNTADDWHTQKKRLISGKMNNSVCNFKPLSHCFEETIEFDIKASFASCPLSRLIRLHNKQGDIPKEF